MAGAGNESFSWSWRPKRRHKMADDALFDEGDDIIGDAVKHILEPPEPCEELDCDGSDLFSCQIAKCGLRFSSVTDYEMHYSNAHRNVCSACRRHFANSHLLDVHILESHNPMFTILTENQNMFSCLVEMCGEKFPSSSARRCHLIDVHKYPRNFRFDMPRKEHKAKTPHNKTVLPDTGNSNVVKSEDVTPLDSVISQDAVISATMDTDAVKSRLQTTPSGDGDLKQSLLSASGRRFVYNVPKNICFGQGSQRGFNRPRGGWSRGRGKKHWHHMGQRPDETNVNIEEVNMADLSAALETS